MKQWFSVRISSFDEHDLAFRWAETAIVFATRDTCVATAFRQINRPSKNTRVHVY